MSFIESAEDTIKRWKDNPIDFVKEAIGYDLKPWQEAFLVALLDEIKAKQTQKCVNCLAPATHRCQHPVGIYSCPDWLCDSCEPFSRADYTLVHVHQKKMRQGELGDPNVIASYSRATVPGVRR